MTEIARLWENCITRLCGFYQYVK